MVLVTVSHTATATPASSMATWRPSLFEASAEIVNGAVHAPAAERRSARTRFPVSVPSIQTTTACPSAATARSKLSLASWSNGVVVNVTGEDQVPPDGWLAVTNETSGESSSDVQTAVALPLSPTPTRTVSG